MLKKFMITETRTNAKGEQFQVKTLCESDEKELKKKLKEKPRKIVDRHYKIEEVK